MMYYRFLEPRCYFNPYSYSYPNINLFIQNNYITLLSKDGFYIKFPYYLIYLSSTIKNYILNAKELAVIPLPFDGSTIKLLNEHVNILPQANYANGRKVYITIEKAVIVHKLLYSLLSPHLNTLNNQSIINLFKIADFLDIKPLLKIYLNEIAKRIFPTFLKIFREKGHLPEKSTIEDNNFNYVRNIVEELEKLKQNPNKDILKQLKEFEIQPHHEAYIFMFVFFSFASIYFRNIEYFSLKEYLALNGQPTPTIENTETETIQIIDLSNKNLTSLNGLKRLENKEVNCLYFNKNFLLDKSLDPDFNNRISFSQFKNLKELLLFRNELSAIPKNFLKNLTKLEEINLEENLIKEIPENTFKDLINLRYLNISHNNLQKLPENIFDNLSNIFIINISNNKLTKLPENIFKGLNNLEALDISYNEIQNLPANTISGLSNLFDLNIANNGLTTLPKNIFHNLNNMRFLDISHNKITHLDTTIFQGLTNLSDLKIAHNNLTTLPENIFHDLNNVNFLDISYNKIQNLHATTFEGLVTLETLNISNNELQTLHPNTFNGLNNLVFLDIANNKLQNLAENTFNDLINLGSLNISHNNLKTLPNNIFSSLNNLEILDLSKNNIENLPVNIFYNLTNLKALNLAENNLKKLETEIFERLTELESLDISSNKIEDLPLDFFKNLLKLKTLLIYNNPLTEKITEEEFRRKYNLPPDVNLSFK